MTLLSLSFLFEILQLLVLGFRILCLLPPSFSSQPHTWPPAISELNTSGLQYSANSRHTLGIDCILAGLDLGDGIAVEASLFSQLLNGPIKQSTRGPDLRRCHDPIPYLRRDYTVCGDLRVNSEARIIG